MLQTPPYRGIGMVIYGGLAMLRIPPHGGIGTANSWSWSDAPGSLFLVLCNATADVNCQQSEAMDSTPPIAQTIHVWHTCIYPYFEVE